MKIYLLICLFTFLSFIGVLIRCWDIIKKYKIPLKKCNHSILFEIIQLMFIVFVPISHIAFLIVFMYLIFANENELKEALEED